MKINEVPTLPGGRIDYASVHPDPEMAREIVIGALVGQLLVAHRGLLRGLDFRTATPEGLSIKDEIRSALSLSGYEGNFGAQRIS